MKKSKIIIVLAISLVFCFSSLIILLNLPKQDLPKQEANDTIKCYNYEDLGINSSKKPSEPWLLCETDDGSLYISPGGGDSGEIYKSTDKGENWTQPNGDFSIGSGIHAFWLDQPNNKLYGASDGDIFYIDLTNDSVTDLGVPVVGASEPGTAKFSLDVWVMGGDIYCGIYYYDLGVEHFYSINKWGGAVWAEEDKVVWIVADYPQYWVSLGVVVGGVYYFVEYDGVSTDSKIYSFTAATSTIALLDTVSPTSTTDSRVMSYDGVDIIYFMLEVNVVRKLHGYSISGSSTTEYGESEIMMMRDCMTGSGLMEKAYHTIEYKVYQLHPNVKHQLYFIAKIPSTTVIVAITDNFLICDDVGTNEFPVYEFIDMSSYIPRVEFVHEIMNYSEGTLGVHRDHITIEKGMFMQIEGKYTSAGSSSDKIIFEGIVIDFDGERLQKVWLESPAKKELERKPRDDFSGRSDEIMTSLVSTYCKYVTIGTLSSGTAMGTITYAGDKTLRTIFNELALFEKWVWKLDPQGRLYFNDGTIDTLVDLSKTDKIWMVKSGEIREPYNYFYLKGAIVDGVQLVKELEEADDLVSQQLHGYNPFERTYASFNAQGILDQLTSNAKAKLKEVPLVVEHWHYDADLGMLAIMETVTFVYDTTNVNVASDQFLINRVLFKTKQNAGGYTIADKLV